jgi:hypothetical protein
MPISNLIKIRSVVAKMCGQTHDFPIMCSFRAVLQKTQKKRSPFRKDMEVLDHK